MCCWWADTPSQWSAHAVLYPGMFGGLSVRSKQSGKELGEIARMTETCLFSARAHSLSSTVSAGPKSVTSANVNTRRSEVAFWASQKLHFALWEAAESGKSVGRLAGRMHHQPVALTGQYAPMHLLPLDSSTTTSPFPPPPRAYNGVPFQKTFFQLNFSTFTRRQYHFHSEMLLHFPSTRFWCLYLDVKCHRRTMFL